MLGLYSKSPSAIPTATVEPRRLARIAAAISASASGVFWPPIAATFTGGHASAITTPNQRGIENASASSAPAIAANANMARRFAK